jgi:hypothetical protein
MGIVVAMVGRLVIQWARPIPQAAWPRGVPHPSAPRSINPSDSPTHVRPSPLLASILKRLSETVLGFDDKETAASRQKGAI